MSSKVLYWIDDEYSFYSILSLFLPEAIMLKTYAGAGRVDDFFDDLRPEISSKDNLFLIDIRMPIPKKLQTFSLWDSSNYGVFDREHVCGIVLAYYLCQEYGIDMSNVRLLTTYGSSMKRELDFFENFLNKDKDKDIIRNESILDKGSFDSSYFSFWLR